MSPVPASALARALTSAAGSRDAVARLGDVLRRDFHADGVLLTSSGTTALELAIRAGARFLNAPEPSQNGAVGSDPGAYAGIVALPAYSCYDLATAAIGAGARVTLYDLDPATLGPDTTSLEAALRRGATTVVIAPLYGVPVDWDRLEALAAVHGALLIEDAAQGHGATWNGRPLGALGRLSILSFGRGKGWTGGGGGALLWRGISLPTDVFHSVMPAGRTSGARTWVAAAAQWLLARPRVYGAPASIPWLGLGETRYHAPSDATSAAQITASLVLATREASLAEAAVRRQRGDWLLRHLPDSVCTPAVPAGGSAGWLRLPVRMGGTDAARVIQLLRHLGVGAAYPTTLADLPELQSSMVDGTPPVWPGADALVRELVTLPTHSRLTQSELDLVRSSLSAQTAAARP